MPFMRFRIRRLIHSNPYYFAIIDACATIFLLTISQQLYTTVWLKLQCSTEETFLQDFLVISLKSAKEFFSRW